jgi:hypothetical protein
MVSILCRELNATSDSRMVGSALVSKPVIRRSPRSRGPAWSEAAPSASAGARRTFGFARWVLGRRRDAGQVAAVEVSGRGNVQTAGVAGGPIVEQSNTRQAHSAVACPPVCTRSRDPS